MSEQAGWQVSRHNGMATDGDGNLDHYDLLELMLRVVHKTDDDGYREFAVAAGDAQGLRALLRQADRDHARLLNDAALWAAKTGLAEARAEKAEALNEKLLRTLEWWVNDEQETAIGPASRIEWLIAWLDETDRKLREYGHKISGDGVQRDMGAWANHVRAAIAEAEAMGITKEVAG